MAKAWFKEKGIEYEDIDVSQDREAAHEMVERSGQMGVPVIDIDGELVIGFNVPKLEEIISRKPKKERGADGKTPVADNIYDVIIIGGAAAGLTSAIYAARREMKTLVITTNVGGQVASTALIENYSGIEQINGADLAKTFEKQAREFGAEIILAKVTKINEKEKEKLFVVTGGDEEYTSRTIILAIGKTPRSMGISGEGEFTGKGVTYCATCDAPMFRDKIVAVVGGGNSAFDAVSLLTQIAKKVYLIHRREEFRAFEGIVHDAKQKENVEFVLNSTVEEVKGDNFVKAIIVKNKESGEMRELDVQGVFVEIGSEVDTDFVKHLVEVDEIKQIKTNKNAETSHPGIFAAGDVTDTPFKQIVVAAGEGSKAALAAYNYIHGFENKYVADWAKQK